MGAITVKKPAAHVVGRLVRFEAGVRSQPKGRVLLVKATHPALTCRAAEIKIIESIAIHISHRDAGPELR